MAIQDTPTRWTIVDPMGTRYEPKVTESAGVIAATDEAGYFTTHRREVAQELQERYPHMLVTEHEAPTGAQRTRTVTWTVPELPWKRETRTERRETRIETGD